MKKITALILASILVIAMTSCAATDTGKPIGTETNGEATTATSEKNSDEKAETTEEVTTEPDNTAAEKLAYYKDLVENGKITVRFATTEETTDDGYKRITSSGYYKFINGESYFEIITEGNMVYIHALYDDGKANPEYMIEEDFEGGEYWIYTEATDSVLKTIDEYTSSQYDITSGSVTLLYEAYKDYAKYEYSGTITENGKTLDIITLNTDIGESEDGAQSIEIYISATENEIVKTVYHQINEGKPQTVCVEYFGTPYTDYMVKFDGAEHFAGVNLTFYFIVFGAFVMS